MHNKICKNKLNKSFWLSLAGISQEIVNCQQQWDLFDFPFRIFYNWWNLKLNVSFLSMLSGSAWTWHISHFWNRKLIQFEFMSIANTSTFFFFLVPHNPNWLLQFIFCLFDTQLAPWILNQSIDWFLRSQFFMSKWNEIYFTCILSWVLLFCLFFSHQITHTIFLVVFLCRFQLIFDATRKNSMLMLSSDWRNGRIHAKIN